MARKPSIQTVERERGCCDGENRQPCAVQQGLVDQRPRQRTDECKAKERYGVGTAVNISWIPQRCHRV